jgi:hypothetical protein
VTLAIDTTAGSDLVIDGKATSANGISIDNSNQTLEIGDAPASLTFQEAESISHGTIQLDGGTLKDAFGLTLGAGSQLTGHGTVTTGTSSTELNGGSVSASDGTLTFTNAVDQSSAGTFNIDVAGPIGATLAFDGAVGAGTIVSFDTPVPATQTLDLTGGGRGAPVERLRSSTVRCRISRLATRSW